MSGLYRLGEYEIDTIRRQILLDGKVVPVQQKPFEVLLALIARAGRVVSKDELLEEIWQKSFVEEANLTQSIFLLRKAFSDKATGSRYIVTVPGRGYQLGVVPIALGSPRAFAEADVEQPPETLNAATAGMPVSPPTAPTNSARTARRIALGVVAVLVVVLGAWIGWRSLRPAPFTHVSVKRLTNSGDVKLVAISPSGRYLALVSSNIAGRESISVSDLRSGNSRVVLSDNATAFSNITFSPDEAYVYYRGSAKNQLARLSSVSRVPVLGGEPAVVVRDVDGQIAFIDGGQRLCFWRGTGDDHFAIVAAGADDGRDETILAKGQTPIPLSAICSPDGKRVALSSEVGGITILDFKAGQRRSLYESPLGKEVDVDLSWKADGSGLLASAVTPFNTAASLVFISYPGAVRTQITNDLISYSSSGFTEDGRGIVALQRNKNAQFQSIDLPLLAMQPAMSPEVVQFPWADFLGWRTDDQIVGSTAAGGLKLKDVAASEEHAVHTFRGVQFLQPSGCGDSGLVAAGGRTRDKAVSIWHMNADGSELKQLTHGQEDILPVCSPDGKWIFYADNSVMQSAAVYRVSAQGGTPTKIAVGSVWFALSHSGNKLAFLAHSEGQQSLALVDTASGKRLVTVPLPATLHVQRSLTFGPDDQHIFLDVGGNTADSVYRVPLNGPEGERAPLKQIEFRGERLAAIAVSPTGKHLGIITVKPTADAVMLEDPHP